jgi:hypothetical protein
VRGVRDDDQVAIAALPRLGAGGEGDPAAEHQDGGLARAGVLGKRGVLGERDDGLAQRLLVAADDGAGHAGVAGLLATGRLADELTRQRVEG